MVGFQVISSKSRQLPPCIYLGRSSVILNKLFCYYLAAGTVEQHSLFAGKVLTKYHGRSQRLDKVLTGRAT